MHVILNIYLFQSIEISKECEYPENEFYVIQLDSSAEEGNYQLYFEFTGHLDGKIIGFYHSTYGTVEGNIM